MRRQLSVVAGGCATYKQGLGYSSLLSVLGALSSGLLFYPLFVLFLIRLLYRKKNMHQINTKVAHQDAQTCNLALDPRKCRGGDGHVWRAAEAWICILFAFVDFAFTVDLQLKVSPNKIMSLYFDFSKLLYLYSNLYLHKYI